MKTVKAVGNYEVLYAGKVFSVERHRVHEADGSYSSKDIVRHPGSSVILPVTDDRKIILIRQYRVAISTEIWELPAGTRDPRETFLQTARRELREETGYRASRWQKLLEYFPSPGFLNESMAIFLAEGLKPGPASPEADEQITVHAVSLTKALQMIREGKICDSKTIIGLLYWQKFARAKARTRK